MISTSSTSCRRWAYPRLSFTPSTIGLFCSTRPPSQLSARPAIHCRGLRGTARASLRERNVRTCMWCVCGRARRCEGLVAVAGDGTLFLDEIDSLPITAQSKLLCLLQEHSGVGTFSSRLRQAELFRSMLALPETASQASPPLGPIGPSSGACRSRIPCSFNASCSGIGLAQNPSEQ